MMSKIKFLTGIVWMSASTIASAQGSATATAVIKGTPYLDEAYAQGEIFYANTSRTVPVRYNAFLDLMEYKQNGQPMVLDPNATVKKVHFGTTTFVVQKFEFKGKAKYGYLVLLDSGKVMLFSKKIITYRDGLKGRALDGTDLPPQYTRSPDVFYYKIGDGELQEVESIKSMIASFPDKRDELTQFAKKEKISPRKENELIQLVQYYNQD
jgi:hypothetical protein